MEKNKDKHKWTYAILNKFYNKENYPKIYNVLNRLSTSGKEEPLITKPQPVQTTFKDRKDDFDKYLKEVANKGLKTIQQEKLSQAREQAKAREEQKFNKTAGTKTVTQEEEQDEEMEQE